MAEKKDYPIKYRRDLSGPLSELLSDFLSDLTRTRQTALLIAASVALLLSLGLATLGDVEAGFVKLNLEAAERTKWVVFAVTLYFLIAYLLGVSADLAVLWAKRWSPLASIEKVEEAMRADQALRTEAKWASLEKVRQLIDEKGEIVTEWKAEAGPNAAGIMTGFAYNELAVIELTEICGSEASQPYLKRIEPINRTIQELAANVSSDERLGMKAEETQLSRGRKLFVYLTRMRVGLEIVFPVLYALFALIWVASHPYVPHPRVEIFHMDE
jgi:hypothetical protein